jgi:hypothetical protein
VSWRNTPSRKAPRLSPSTQARNKLISTHLFQTTQPPGLFKGHLFSNK